MVPDVAQEESFKSLYMTICLTPEQRIDPYEAFLERKRQGAENAGFAPLWMPNFLFDFQAALVEWAIRQGRAALLTDCGTGKTPMSLTWAENIVRHTNKRVLILTPLAVGSQFVQEGEKFGVACGRSRDGILPSEKIVITNYEKLHLFDANDFIGVVCDEASCLKHFSGATQKAVTRFLLKIPYRLMATATAAPNDYIELGTLSEALGYLGYSDMLSRFFVMDDKKRHRMNDVKLARAAKGGDYYQKLSYRVAQQIGQWRMKGHAEVPFWEWVSSWARACRKPSDLGFADADFILPPLTEEQHLIEPKTAPDGMLFTLPAFGLQEERDERRRTLTERCEYVVKLVDHDRPAVVWCHLNTEGDLLEKLIPHAKQIKGTTEEEEREDIYADFKAGRQRVLVIKPKIGAWGVNWQFCNHVVTFASHSFEQYYQSVRRCYRFGQTRPVTVDIVATTGEEHVRENMMRKAAAADKMFSNLIQHMHNAQEVKRAVDTKQVEVPAWLS